MVRNAIVRQAARRVVEAAHCALDLLYPPHCCHCEAPLAGTKNRVLCPQCLHELASSRICPPFCPVCGLPYEAHVDRTATCLACRTRPPHFDMARAVFSYAGPAGSLVKKFKFHGDYFLGSLLLRRAIELCWLPDDLDGFDCIVPVPLHGRRERERGYNQAALLAGTLARFAGVPLRGRALERRRHTDQQARLGTPGRWRNIRGAFAPGSQGVAGEHVLLVDDVLTTGATASECARVLKHMRAARVCVLTLVRTRP